MAQTLSERHARLHAKAMMLPMRPGVYIMKDKNGAVIYVGKSKVIRSRVSQYFAPANNHDLKTTHMTAAVYDFDFILADTEIEALALENKLIKLYMPRYNINLKDGKSYPYVRLGGKDSFPTVTVTRTRKSDGARYFGPYSGMKRAWGIAEIARNIFALPRCKYSFPKDSGRIKPCIYSKIGKCQAPCSVEKLEDTQSNSKLYEEIASFLSGRVGSVRDSLKAEMDFASENLMFEAAAALRDRIDALDRLRDAQKTVGAPDDEYDVIALYRSELCSCLAIFPVREGVLINGEHIIFGSDRLCDDDAVSSAICEFYLLRGYVPKKMLVGFDLSVDDAATVQGYLRENVGTTTLYFPRRGDKKKICDMLCDSARLYAEQWNAQNERDADTLASLSSILALESVPDSIEAIDISNLGDEAITAGLVRYSGTKPDKRGYRTYKIRSTSKQDDYLSMSEALERRVSHAAEQPLPDLFLLDGGKGHVNTIKSLFASFCVEVPVFGMVKDDRHRTRAITDGEREYDIASDQAVYTFIYKMQEEVHRYTVGRMMNRKRKSLTSSSLTNITGIGSKKAAILFRAFGSLSAIKASSKEEIAAVKGISEKDAENIVNYFIGDKQ